MPTSNARATADDGRTGRFAHRWLPWAACASLALHLRAAYFGPPWHVFLFKPLTTLCVIALAWTTRDAVSSRYRLAIIAGLFASLAGDVFLMLPGDFFVFGLVSFLVAHVCYLTAFVADGGPRFTRLALPCALAYAGLEFVLVPRVGNLAGPVLVYGFALVTMAWQAGERWSRTPTDSTRAAAVGGASFVVSDSILAVDRFVGTFALAPVAVMTTYVLAQVLIAKSVKAPAGRFTR